MGGNQMKKGIDVSQHQGVINWEKVKNAGIEFAMLRIGYSITLDKQFKNNVDGCVKNNIPFGVYLFSYALNADEAIAEADFLLEQIKDLTVEYPVAFDFEYDSFRYMEKMNVIPTAPLINEITIAFCNRIEKAGYYCMNYTNKDFYNNWFDDIVNTKYDLWVAHWGVLEPFKRGGIWQHTSTGKVDGINGNVDLNFAYKNYVDVIQELGLNNLEKNVDWKAEYYKLLNDIKTLADLYV